MGINSAADKWKWAGIHFIEMLPKFQGTLVNVDKATQSIDAAARGVDTATRAFILVLCIITFAIIIHYYLRNCGQRQIHERKLNRDYLRIHYGDGIDMMCGTYIALIKFHSSRVGRSKAAAGADDTKVVLVGANEEVESRIWLSRFFDGTLDSLLFDDRRFLFRSITEAMQAVDDYCKPSGDESKVKRSKTLFIFLLISSQDPNIFGPQYHETFRAPSSLCDHCYEIVGTGFHDIAAHKLSISSTAPNGDPLVQSLPISPREAGIAF